MLFSVSDTEAMRSILQFAVLEFIFFMSSQLYACYADSCVPCRDLITLEARVSLLLNGPCAILMTGYI